MLPLVLSAVLAAAPAPRAPTGASLVIHVPRLDRLGGLHAFLSRSGQHAALLQPSVWYAELHPLLALDPSRPEALLAAGVDASGPATVSVSEHGRTACLHLSNPAAFQSRADAALQQQGPLKRQVARGVTVLSAPREAGGEVGYALKGEEACAFVASSPGVDAPRREAEQLVARAPRPLTRLAKVPGAVFVLWPGRGVVGLEASATELRLEGVSEQRALVALQGAGPSPYASVAPAGLLVARARVVPGEALGQAVAAVRARVQQVCAACPRELLAGVAREVATQLTGQALWSVSEVKVRGSLRQPAVRFFAPRQAVAAEVKDVAAVRAALAPLGKLAGVQVLEDGYALPVEGGRLVARLTDRHLVLGNHEAAAQALAGSLPGKAGPLAHGVEFSADPRGLARGLAQVSVLDVAEDTRLAGLFAAAVELGPLLSSSERLAGWVDDTPGGGHRFALTWSLPAP